MLEVGLSKLLEDHHLGWLQSSYLWNTNPLFVRLVCCRWWQLQFWLDPIYLHYYSVLIPKFCWQLLLRKPTKCQQSAPRPWKTHWRVCFVGLDFGSVQWGSRLIEYPLLINVIDLPIVKRKTRGILKGSWELVYQRLNVSSPVPRTPLVTVWP